MKVFHFLKKDDEMNRVAGFDKYFSGYRGRLIFQDKEEYDRMRQQFMSPWTKNKEIFLPYFKELQEVTNERIGRKDDNDQ